MRFKKPVLEVTWATLPMLGILAIGVLLITYVPWLTLGLLRWMGRSAMIMFASPIDHPAAVLLAQHG